MNMKLFLIKRLQHRRVIPHGWKFSFLSLTNQEQNLENQGSIEPPIVSSYIKDNHDNI